MHKVSGAYIESSKLKPACEQYLKERNARVEREKEEAIADLMTQKHGLFSKRLYTREEAVERLSHGMNNIYAVSVLGDIENTGSYWANIVERLLMLSNSAESVYVTSEDIEPIARYLEAQK